MGIGSSRGAGHPGSANDLEFEYFGDDPSVVGLPRPIGWRVGLPDGTAAWDKTGPLDTDWTPITAASLVGVTQIIAGTNVTVSPPGGTGNVTVNATVPASVTSLDGLTGDLELASVSPGLGINNDDPNILFSQFLAADWDPSVTRIYAVDGTSGNDGHKGYADPASASEADYELACAAAGAVAFKTFAPLAALFPRLGMGRKVLILIRGGGLTYAGGLDLFLSGCVGYVDGCPIVRGTATSTTAASVAFSGDANDRNFCGAATATGMNAAGYNPTGAATATSIPCTKVGGAAPAFVVGMGVPLGWRIRFDAATATAALQNQCVPVAEISATNTLIPSLPLNAAPGATDVFYLEMAGVNCGAYSVGGDNVATPQVSPGTVAGITIVGVRSTGQLTILSGMATFVLCSAATLVAGAVAQTALPLALQASPFYSDPFGSYFMGGGLRIEGAAFLGPGNYNNQFGLVTVGRLTISAPTALFWGDGCAASQIVIQDAKLGLSTSALFLGPNPNLGTNSPIVQSPKIFGTGTAAAPLIIVGSDLSIEDMTIVGAGAHPCVSVRGICRIIGRGVISGSTGNTDVGLDLQNACLSTIELRAGHLWTVTGTAGDLRWANQAFGVWTNFNFSECYDQAGNRIFEGNTNGAAYNATMNPSVFAGVHVNASGSDPAFTLMRASGSSGQVTPAFADTVAHASGLAGVLLAAAANGAACLYGGMSGYMLVQFDAAPTFAAVAYLSKTTAGTATTTVPTVSITEAKLRIGIVVGTAFAGNLALVRMNPEIVATLADGLP